MDDVNFKTRVTVTVRVPIGLTEPKDMIISFIRYDDSLIHVEKNGEELLSVSLEDLERVVKALKASQEEYIPKIGAGYYDWVCKRKCDRDKNQWHEYPWPNSIIPNY